MEMEQTLLAGCTLFLVEDDWLLASTLAELLRDQGASIQGPFASVAKALEGLADDTAPLPDVAVLDVNLGGEAVWPVADALVERGVPLVFLTGYGADIVPARFRSAPCMSKPVGLTELIEHLCKVPVGRA
jgi:DNA-binding response OmpR family regulator